MTTIAVYNIKGGVGKSTTAVNLACLAGREGHATLLWDLDPQGAAGYYLGQAGESGRGSGKLTRGKEKLRDLAAATGYANLDLVPARFSYRRLDIHLHGQTHRRTVLSKLLAPLAATYRWVFLDCPPGITLLSENVFAAADLLLVPLVPTPLSLRTFEEIVVFYGRKGLDLSRVLPFFSLVERRKKIHQETMRVFAARESRVCRSVIPSLSDIERMALTRRPPAYYRPRSEAGRSYAALWAEVKIDLANKGGEGRGLS
jgi:cellulose biosynthesis protein BcsQ